MRAETPPPGFSHLSITIVSWYYVEELVSNAFFSFEDSIPTSLHTDRVISPRKLQSLYVGSFQSLPMVLFIPGTRSMQLPRWTILQETFLPGAVSHREADTLSSNIFNCPVKLTIIELIIEETIPDTLTESSVN